MDLWERFSVGFGILLERPPSAHELDLFSSYLALLRQWNRGRCLTAYSQPEDIVGKLFLDSLLFLRFLPMRTRYVLDIGSGAGIPGVPVAIVQPDISVTLMEARRRKVSFLRAVVRDLALTNVAVIEGRAGTLLEELPALRARFDAVVTRASGPVCSVSATASQFLKAGGIFVASGPPVGKQKSANGGSWEIATHPTSGLSRQFYIVKKPLEVERGDLGECSTWNH